MGTNIWWIRRDLRLEDNQALSDAISSADNVIPLFILDPKLIASSKSGSKRFAFLGNSLDALDKDLRTRGSRLVLRRGTPVDVLTVLAWENQVNQIFAEADYSPYARRRDEQVARQLPLKLSDGLSVSHPEALMNKNGNPYRVFTPYMRNWKAQYSIQSEQLLPAPDHLSTPTELPSEGFPIKPGLGKSLLFEPGEKAANARLDAFLNSPKRGIYCYAEQRNRMDMDGTAVISPYLRFGLLSMRHCVYAAQLAMKEAPDQESRVSAEIWLNELIWREFYLAILYHFPGVMKNSFREDLRAISWRNDADEFLAWCEGRTGYPIVDAAMRQLLETGWMHNRGRMIVASFLVKDLIIDWRWGERFFMQQLVDGDPAANNGGWQWTAGTGTDAAPYFRVFNPVLQGKKFDPQGVFIRRWLPVLSEVPEKFIHSPWFMPEEIQRQSRCIIGQDYPYPIIDHSFARERILEVYNRAKQSYQP
ncbi:MAG: deoxyribodipyrimidine photo-lyase [Anaerolineales bacterium]|nr:deoxyribodipyrimidine photo-lyase [Anaerolineales bacterium]